jgi:hypothetical protein
MVVVVTTSKQVFLHPLTVEEVRSLSGVISAVKSQAKSKAGVTMRQTKAKRQNNKLLAQLDVQFVSDFFGALLKEGTDYLGMDPELEAYKELMLTHPKSMRPLLDTLEELLFSSWPLDRHYGINWLFDLMVVLIENDPDHAAATSSGLSSAPSTPSTPVQFGAGRGAAKGRGRPLSSLRPVSAVPVSPRGPLKESGIVSPKAAPGQAPPPLGPSNSSVALKMPAKERPVSIPVKSPRAPGISFANLETEANNLNSSSSNATNLSPRLPLLQMPESSPLRLKLAGNTPEEITLSFQKMRTLVTDTHEKLLTSPSAGVRSGYALVVKRLLSYVRSRFALAPDHAVSLSVSFINKLGANLLSRRETDPLMLMQLFDLIFDFVASESATGPSATTSGVGSASPAGPVPTPAPSPNLVAEECKVQDD